ncbi:LamG-like jellyroll fold domain-containing protein [Flavobacterium sp. XGLA_31]|uniref:LamG-like jellyroll fold domain-containing protein n=1 Tax=Flavobacterium sp. XGLA_31 TaxID=3447666 RepID=UPI003F39E9F7
MKKLLLNSGKKCILLFALLITLVSEGQNLYDSAGTIIWDATLNTGYNNNVTKIGRDDLVSLNQKQFVSISTPSFGIGLGTITSSNATNTNTFGSDRMFLVWGDNNASMNDSGSDLVLTFGGTSGVTTTTDLPSKRWKIVETGGDVNTTKVAIATSAFSGLPALSGNDAYVMIIASDASFTTNVETVFLSANGSNQEALFDFDGTQYFTFGIAHETVTSKSLTFNGIDNIMKMGNTNNLASQFSMMAWIRPTGQNATATDRTIASKYDGSNGFRMFLTTDNKIHVMWDGVTHLTSSVTLPFNQWHNVAIVYNGTNVKLYIDGVVDTSVVTVAPNTNSNTFSIGAEYKNKTITKNYFKGDIDEFKIWNKALTITQIRFMLNQEILQNGTSSKGAVLSGITRNDISGINWVNLTAYYTMNSFIGTTVNDDSSYNNRGNVFSSSKVTVDTQTAPLPYKSSANGLWSDSSTWANGSIQSIPGSVSIVNNSVINWNIVQTNHNINSTGNKLLMGLIVANNTLSFTNDTKVKVSHYLKLNGKLDLVGRSQLLQDNNSELDVSSSGYLERDQQGQSNKYNYNYWSSPVSTINTTSVNNGYTVSAVMKDGTDPNAIQNIQWTTSIDAVASNPITLSDYWIFKFQNTNNNLANWSYTGPNGTLLAGQGFTLKGSAAATANQNYTFVGKPNNGTITSPISANNLNLCGNPYPSALNSDLFIKDNLTAITGTLYFWEQYSTNASHIMQQYQGGYATRTLVGGTPPISPSGVSGLGSSSKTPGKNIPVGQGFFVTGSATGGNIVFKNSHRAFIKENHASSYTLFKSSNATATVDNEFDNSEDEQTEEPFIKLRLGFNSFDQHHRQILLGFMNENATSGFDMGYDAKSIEIQSDDMYFMNNSDKLNIQGDGYFNVNNIYPLGVVTSSPGDVSFVLDEQENLPESQEVYIYDSLTDVYTSIKNEPFTISLPAGNADYRFSLRFNNPAALGVTHNNLADGITVYHSQVNNMINIQNKTLDAQVKTVLVYNLMGQNVASFKVDNQDQTNIQLPVTTLNTGAYIVKVTTDKGDTTKKIVIK